MIIKVPWLAWILRLLKMANQLEICSRSFFKNLMEDFGFLWYVIHVYHVKDFQKKLICPYFTRTSSWTIMNWRLLWMWCGPGYNWRVRWIKGIRFFYLKVNFVKSAPNFMCNFFLRVPNNVLYVFFLKFALFSRYYVYKKK